MIGSGNSKITMLLVLIVIILIFGVGIALYFVLDLDWFDVPEKPQDIIKNECEEKQILASLDIKKRVYNIELLSEDMRLVVYKDGTVGITMLDTQKNSEVSIYSEIINKEVKVEVEGIVKAYEVKASKTSVPTTYIVLIDKDGNVYKLDNNTLMTQGGYKVIKITGLAKILDIKQITNENLVENTDGINVIAIDYEGNELLITDYLVE